MKNLLRLLSIISAVVILGCETELPVPQSKAKPRSVVYSELVAGKKAEMRIGKSKPVGPDIDNYFEQVTDATAQLMDADNNVLEQLHYVRDTNSNMGLYKGNTRIDANKTYKVQVTVPDMKVVTASAWIPTPIKVELLDTASTQLNGRPVLRFHLSIPPAQKGAQFIVMEALKQMVVLDTIFRYQGVRYRKKQHEELYNRVKDDPGCITSKDSIFLNSYLRIPVYTQDENADNNQVGGLNENYNSILFTQVKQLTTNFYINAAALTASTADDDPPIGRVLVNIKSVSKEYYDFLLTYEKLRRNPGLNSLIQAIQLRSNTAGGLGVVGGVSQVVYYLYYDPL